MFIHTADQETPNDAEEQDNNLLQIGPLTALHDGRPGAAQDTTGDE